MTLKKHKDNDQIYFNIHAKLVITEEDKIKLSSMLHQDGMSIVELAQLAFMSYLKEDKYFRQLIDNYKKRYHTDYNPGSVRIMRMNEKEKHRLRKKLQLTENEAYIYNDTVVE